MACVVILPLVALLAEMILHTDMAERHHIHHDTYSVSLVITRTTVLVMVFMGSLGVMTGWLCHLGVFATDPSVVLSFFTSFQLTLLVVHSLLGRYRVTTYSDRLTVRPFLGRTKTMRYDEIARMEWVVPAGRGLIRDLNVHAYDGRVVRLWGILDIGQMLMRIDRFDALDG